MVKSAPPTGEGILLEDLTWQEAEIVLRPGAIVVIPIGAACKEHGPHLTLKNDWALGRIFQACDSEARCRVDRSYRQLSLLSGFC